MRRWFTVIALVGVLCTLPGCSGKRDSELLRKEIASVSSLKQLTLVEYKVRKIIKANDEGEWYKIGDRKIILSCTAYLKAGIDLSTFSADDVTANRAEGKVTISLPHASLLSLNIPPSEIREEYDQVTLLRSGFSAEERNRLLRQGERQIRESVIYLGILDKAEENARKFFTSIFSRMGYTTVDVVFK